MARGASRDAVEWAGYYMKRFHQALGVNITMKCPLECAHCGQESGPRRTETLNEGLFISRLREMGEAGQIKQLVISGGEPFAVRRLLARVLAIAAEYGIRAQVQTSANWAVTEERAAAVLRELPGLTHLGVSADEYHEPFVPLENLKHALRALSYGDDGRVVHPRLEQGGSLHRALVQRAWRRVA